MFSIALLTTFTLAGFQSLAVANPIAQQIAPNSNVPDGYQVGFSTQDYEPAGQQSACTINGGSCQAPTPLYPSTSGPPNLPPGVYAAAITGLGPNDCTICGTCYNIISSGTPYCDPNANSGCAVPSGNEDQSGPSSILVLITNHCPNCVEVPGHFDINNAPAGWDNAKIYYQQVDASECGQ